MARRVLLSAEKEQLQSNSTFALHVKWSLLNKASYWNGHDGSNAQSVGGLERWRKAKTFAKAILNNPSNIEGTENVKKFLAYFKDELCVDDQVQEFNASETITHLLTGTQNVDKFDAASDAWFDAQIASTL